MAGIFSTGEIYPTAISLVSEFMVQISIYSLNKLTLVLPYE
jgi:hypothetical protein